jgi:DEAD/DEAH box helicase domain-containing protein
MLTEVFFDCETKKMFSDLETFDPAGLGVSIVSVYRRKIDIQLVEDRQSLKEVEGVMQSFWENDFPKMWSLFNDADRIIGFNSIKFDVPALSPYSPPYFAKLPHFDIMDELKKILGHRISLDALAKETLQDYKSDHGENAVEYWAKGDPESLKKLQFYCEKDVAITRDIYDYAMKNKQLKFKDKWNEIRTVELDFSYPKSDNIPQIGLF